MFGNATFEQALALIVLTILVVSAIIIIISVYKEE